MKRNLLTVFVALLICIPALTKPLKPENASKADLTNKGIVFGTCAEVKRDLDVTKPVITYYIRKKDSKKKPEKLTSKRGLFTYSLEPGTYQIFEWSLSGAMHDNGFWVGDMKTKKIYEFEVVPGHLTYIGRIVTDVFYVQGSGGTMILSNYPRIADERQTDVTLLLRDYPTFEGKGLVVDVEDGFYWRELKDPNSSK